MVSPYSPSRAPAVRRPVVPPEYAQAAPQGAPAVPVAPMGPPNTSTAPTGQTGPISRNFTPVERSGAMQAQSTSPQPGRAPRPPDPNQASTDPTAAHAAYSSTWKYSRLVGPGTARTTGTAPPLPNQTPVLPMAGSVVGYQAPGYDPDVARRQAAAQAERTVNGSQESAIEGKGGKGGKSSKKTETGSTGQGLGSGSFTGNTNGDSSGKVSNLGEIGQPYIGADGQASVSQNGYELWQKKDGSVWERRPDGYYPYDPNSAHPNASNPGIDSSRNEQNSGDLHLLQQYHQPGDPSFKIGPDGSYQKTTDGVNWSSATPEEYQAAVAKARDAKATADKLAGDNRDFDAWIRDMITAANQNAGLDEATINNQIAAQQKRQAFEQSKSLSSALALAQKGGMNGEGLGGLGSDINREFATRGQEMEANTRSQAAMANLQVKMQNIQHTMQALQMAAQNAASKEQRDMALAAQKELMALNTKYQQQLMEYQMELSSPSFGDIMGGLLGGLGGAVLGPIGSAVGAGLGSKVGGLFK